MMDWIRLPEAVPSFGAMVGWAPQPLPVLPLIGVLLAAWYGWGVYRVTSSGRVWPWTRTASFLFGCILLILVTGARRRGLRVRTLQYLDVPAFDLVDGDSTTARSRQPRSSPAALHPSHRVGEFRSSSWH